MQCMHAVLTNTISGQACSELYVEARVESWLSCFLSAGEMSLVVST